jgi:hypothetical protein
MLGKIRTVELQKNEDMTALVGVIEAQHGKNHPYSCSQRPDILQLGHVQS